TNTTVLSGDVVEEVSKVRDEAQGDVVVHGSRQLAQTLLEHDLVDELHLMVSPVVLGTGARLFGETTQKKPLKLVDSKIVGDGVAILVYRPDRGEQSWARGRSAPSASGGRLATACARTSCSRRTATPRAAAPRRPRRSRRSPASSG